MAARETTGVGQALTPHLVYCWELGQGYGHLLNFRRLALLLLHDGWRVSAIVRDAGKARRLLPAAVDVIAMQPLRGQPRFNPTVNLAEILLNNDFADVARVQARVDWWQQQLAALAPDVLLIDHAPTALLAGVLMQHTIALLGSGFFIPPNRPQLPLFSLFTSGSSAAEAELVGVFNQVKLQQRQLHLTALADLFYRTDVQFLCTFAELDHYGVRPDGEYWGAISDFGFGDAPVWPDKPGPKVFMYLHGDYPALPALLDEVQRLDYNVLAHIGGWQHDGSRWPAMKFMPTPVQLEDVAAQADLVICHAGHATIAGMLLRQKKLLLIPKQLEQLLLADRLWQQQLALVLTPGGDVRLLGAICQTLLHDADLPRRLQHFAAYYAGYSVEEQAQEMLLVLNELVAAQPPPA